MSKKWSTMIFWILIQFFTPHDCIPVNRSREDFSAVRDAHAGSFTIQSNASVSYLMRSPNTAVDREPATNCTLVQLKSNCTPNNNSEACDCDSRYESANLFSLLIFHYLRLALFSFFLPVAVLVGIQVLLGVRRIVTMMFLLGPFTISIMLLLAFRVKSIEIIVLVVIPSLLHVVVTFLLAFLFLLSSNFVSKSVRSVVSVRNYRKVEIPDEDRYLYLCTVFGFVFLVFKMIAENFSLRLVPARLSKGSPLDVLTDPLYFANLTTFFPEILLLTFMVLTVFGIDRYRKVVNPEVPPRLNVFTFGAYLVALATWIFGVVITLEERWELWFIFVLISAVEPVMFSVVTYCLERCNQ